MGNEKFSSGVVDMRNDPKVMEKMRLALRAGNTYEASCRMAGIGVTTFTRWMKQGREAKEGTPARYFFDLVELATTEAENVHTLCIRKAAIGGDWRASAWWLERRRSASYARRDIVNIGNDGDNAFAVSVSEGTLTDEEKQAALRAILRRNPSLVPDMTVT